MKYFDTSNDYKALIELGLNKTEALIYLSALDLGQGTVSEIARNAEVERTGVYYHIETLLKNSLLQAVNKGKRTIYLPADPKILQQILEQKKTLLEHVYPKIDRQFSLISNRSISEYYFGVERARQFYDRLYQLLAQMKAPDNIVYVFGNSYKAISSRHDSFLDFQPPTAQIDIKMKCILPKSQKAKPPGTNRYDPYIVKRFNLPSADLKFIPDKYAYYAAVVVINNIICLLDYRNFSYAILENANVAKSWKAFFSFIWDYLK